MVTLERHAASSAHRTPRATRLPFVAAAILLAGVSHPARNLTGRICPTISRNILIPATPPARPSS